MADAKISALAEGTTFGDTDLAVIVQSGTTKKIQGSNFKAQVIAYDAEISALAGLTSAADKLPYFTGSGTASLADLTSFARTLLDDANAAAFIVTLGLTATIAELNYCDGVTSAIQTQLDAKQGLDAELTALAGLTSAANKLPYFTGSGTASLADLTSFGRSIIDDANAAAMLVTLGITATVAELNYVDGVTSAIQTQLDGKQASDAELSALAGLTSAANKLPYFTGSGTASLADLTAFARSILDDADEATFKATVNLEIGTDVLAQQTIGVADDNLVEVDQVGGLGNGEYVRATANGVESRSEAEFKADYNLEIGTDVQAYDAELAALAGLTSAANKLPYFTGSGTASLADLTAFARTLLDDADAATALATLGLTATAAELNVLDGITATVAELNVLDGITATVTELNYCDGVTSAIQTQIDGKLANVVEDTTPQLGGALDGQGYDLNNLGVIFLTEQASAESDVAGKGQTWVKTATPNQLWFTDDAGNDILIAKNNSDIRYLMAVVVDFTTDCATGDGKMYFHIPPALNGMNLVYCHAEVITAGTTGTMDIQIHELVGAVDMLSTKLTIDSGETGSDTAATAYVINTSNDDVATNDVIRVDVDAIHTTPAKGLIVTLGFSLP